MGINEVLKKKREEILRVAARHSASNIRIFGSVARGESDEKSDLDLLVTMEAGEVSWIMRLCGSNCGSSWIATWTW